MEADNVVRIEAGLTKQEIELATERLVVQGDGPGIVDLEQITANTLMVRVLLEMCNRVRHEVAVLAAYHHGLRTGLQVAADRVAALEPDKKREDACIQTKRGRDAETDSTRKS